MTELAEEALEVTDDIMSLSDMFNDEEVVETETVEAAEPEKVEKAEVKPEVEEPKEEPQKVETTATEQESGQMAALIAERRKRQEAENKLKEYESKAVVPDPIEDPEGYSNYIKQDNQSAMFQTRVTLSRDLMIDNTPDYAEKESVFMGLVVDKEGNVINPMLLQQFQESVNPARFAYNHAKEHLEVQQLKDPKYRENLEAELRLKILKELEAETSKPRKLSAVQVPDLTTATASAKNSEIIDEDGEDPKYLFGNSAL